MTSSRGGQETPTRRECCSQQGKLSRPPQTARPDAGPYAHTAFLSVSYVILCYIMTCNVMLWCVALLYYEEYDIRIAGHETF